MLIAPLRVLVLFAAAALCSRIGASAQSPFAEAEESFLQELNSIAGIELGGGPFHASEQHHFEGESGYFVLSPAVPLPTLDQRLTVQTRAAHTAETHSTNTLPIVTSPYTHDDSISAADRQQIHTLLAEHRFAVRRDEITAFDLNTIQLRTVSHLAILKIVPASCRSSSAHSRATNHCVFVLLGSQPWQGIPLYRATFDRIRGDFELESLRVNFISRSRYEVPRRHPFLAAQTFFAEPGLNRADWAKLLRNFALLDLPAVEIVEAAYSDRHVNLYADTDKPILPQQWVKLEKQSGRWTVVQAVEFRAEFPRPGAWWTFLPLLPSPTTPPPDLFPDSEIPSSTRRELITLVSRLRGVGQIIYLASKNDTTLVRTAHDDWRGYDLEFTQIQNSWRFTSVTEWTK